MDQVRKLFESDLTNNWHIGSVSKHFSMSEATLRRRLSKSGHHFSKILLNTKLEKGLFLLQTTNLSISQVAFDCGFNSSSHFSSSFKKRFKISPKSLK